MNLFEFYTAQNDRSQITYAGDTRSPVITFEKLSKLRKIRDTRKEENRKHDELVMAMYSMPAEEDGGMGGGFGGDIGGGGGFGGAPPMGDFEGGMDDFDMGEMGDEELDMGEADMDAPAEDFDLDLDIGDEEV